MKKINPDPVPVENTIEGKDTPAGQDPAVDLTKFTAKNPAEDQAEETSSSKTNKKSRCRFKLWPDKRWKQALVLLFLFFLVLLSAASVLGIYTYQVGMELKNQAAELQEQMETAYYLFSVQDLPQAETELLNAQTTLKTLSSSYQKINLYRYLPVVSTYYLDGESGIKAADHGLNAAIIAAQAITPYADILGFEGEASFEGGTVEDRIELMLETIEVIYPQLDEIEQELAGVQTEFGKINSQNYPEEFQGIKIRSEIEQAQSMVNQGITLLSEFRPVIEQLPAIAGASGEGKKYLILFQNNNELRPTGGFLTAYSIVNVEGGKITPEKSGDIYDLDQKFTERIEIPENLGRYLTTERFWNLRDMNTSPDFKQSMNTFFENYQTVRGEPDDIDGIISVDTHILTGLLEILGPVEVPGYGTFSSQEDPRCECPQVVYALSEIITRPTPYLRENRKGILGPMMQAILQKTYAAPKQDWPQLFAFTWDSMQGRHLQMYFVDEVIQTAAENINAAGRLQPVEGQDFLAIVDANLGGAKSNLFTDSEVEQYVVGPENGKIIKTVEITYRNHREADNCDLEAGELCLNATMPVWHRLYLPAGSEIIEAQGFTQDPEKYEELGFYVVDGFFRLEPKGAAKIIVEYSVPYELEDYQLTIWKQGGVDAFETLIDVNGNQAKLTVDKDVVYGDEF